MRSEYLNNFYKYLIKSKLKLCKSVNNIEKELRKKVN